MEGGQKKIDKIYFYKLFYSGRHARRKWALSFAA